MSVAGVKTLGSACDATAAVRLLWSYRLSYSLCFARHMEDTLKLALPVVIMLALPLAACGSQPAPSVTKISAAAAPARSVPSETAMAEAAAVDSACDAARGVAGSVLRLRNLPALDAMADMDVQGPAWSKELSAGETRSGDPDIPRGRNKANEANVSLAELALAIDFADIAYESGQRTQAVRNYTKFDNLLGRMIRKDCR